MNLRLLRLNLTLLVHHHRHSAVFLCRRIWKTRHYRIPLSGLLRQYKVQMGLLVPGTAHPPLGCDILTHGSILLPACEGEIQL